MNKDSLFDAYMPPWQCMATRQINQTMQITYLLYGLVVGLQAFFFKADSCTNAANKRKRLSLLLFTYHTSLRSVSLKAGNGPENSEALSGHSFCFFGTECLEVQGQLGRLAARVVEGGESKRQREKGGVGPIGPFVMRLICTTALNWLQQLINVLESWHKKFI